MTTEHKILHLLDRGVIGREELSALVGREANREGLRLLDAGLLEWTKPPYLRLTALGVRRLDELDDQQQLAELPCATAETARAGRKNRT